MNLIKEKIRNPTVVFLIMGVAVLSCFLPAITAADALIMGILVALSVGNPFVARTKIISQKLLSYSIIGLGAGMNLVEVAKAGLSGILVTVVTISLTLILGMLMGHLMKSNKETSILISVGTAICGGSAIAAVAPVIKANSQSTSVAFGVVFLLNALALFIFPVVGHSLGLSQQQFGLWSALAIHDTSSVVGAGLQYGAEALRIGTTVKLARALWIVPLTLGLSVWVNRKTASHKKAQVRKPWFILGFLLTAALVTWIPALKNPGHEVEWIARKCLVVTLFFIGSNLTLATLKEVGLRPFAQAFLLWLIVASSTLLGIVFWPS